jgi:hypothetical protein
LFAARGVTLRAAHPMELLDASIRGVSVPGLEPETAEGAPAPAAGSRSG